MKRFNLFPLTLLALACLQKASAFQHHAAVKSRKTVVLHSSVQEVESRRATRRRYSVIEKQDPSALTFSGSIVKTSRPLVPIEDKQRLIDFFKTTRARDTLFVSDSRPVPVNPISPKLFREWQLETQKLGVNLPIREEGSTQTVMQLCSEGISFSGLHVETTVNCGAKLIDYCPDTGLPAYEFTMINDRTSARGPRPLMWIYNQVMGFVSNKNKAQSKTTTSLCRIALVEVKGGIAIDFESSFQVKVNFPPFLLRILPVSKSRAEQQGSSAVSRFVQKGVVDSVQRFEQAFADTSKLSP